MKLLEDTQNLLNVNNYTKNPYVLAYFMPADLVIKDSTAKSLMKKFNKDFVRIFESGEIVETLIKTKTFEVPIYNLIVKRFNFNEFDYEIVTKILENLRDILIRNNQNRLAIADSSISGKSIDWVTTKEIIQKVFENTDITVKICLN